MSTHDEALKFYTENKENLLKILFDEHPGDIDCQEDYDQVAVWFDGWSICYQATDMDGYGRNEVHWNNSGADCGLDELCQILEKDSRFKSLIAYDNADTTIFISSLINDFCCEYAEKNGIVSIHGIIGYPMKR